MKNGDYKLGVEGRLKAVEVSLEEVKTNHLPHLDAKIDKMDVKIDRLQYLVIVTLVGVVVNLLMRGWNMLF